MTSRVKKVQAKKATPRRLSFRVDIPRLTERIHRWSRPLRIGAATLISIIWVGLLMGVLNLVLPASAFENPDSALYVVLALTGAGILMYGVGWTLLVGFDLDPDVPWRARRSAAYYVVAGGIAVLLSVIGIIVGVLYALVF